MIWLQNCTPLLERLTASKVAAAAPAVTLLCQLIFLHKREHRAALANLAGAIFATMLIGGGFLQLQEDVFSELRHKSFDRPPRPPASSC